MKIVRIPIKELKSRYFTHTAVWANLKQSVGWEPHAFRQFEFPALEEDFLVLIKRFPFFGYFAYLADGLIPFDFYFFKPQEKKTRSLPSLLFSQSDQQIQKLFYQMEASMQILGFVHDKLQDQYGRKIFSFRWDMPWVLEVPNNVAQLYSSGKFFSRWLGSDSVRKSYIRKRYRIQERELTQPPATVMLNLTKKTADNVSVKKTEEELLQSFKRKTRYNIRLAQKHGVEVKRNIKLLDFFVLLKETAARNSIAIHSLDYFEELQKRVLQHGNMELVCYGAYYNNILLASIIVLFYCSGIQDGHQTVSANLSPDSANATQNNNENSLSNEGVKISSLQKTGKAVYLYGASSSQHRELMPSYLLQWEAIREALKKNCLYYDLFGVSKNSVAKTRMSGLYRFKTGFSKNLWIRPCAVNFNRHDIRLRMKNRLFGGAETLRRWYYHVLRK